MTYFADGYVYVDKAGSDFYGIGTHERPFATIGAALAALVNNPGRVKVGLGQFVESNHVQYEGQYIDGVTPRFIAGTILRPPSPTADVLTFTAPDCGASNLQVYADTPWTGTAFRLEHALYFRGDNLGGRASNGFATATNGGVGIYVYEMEGWHLEDCRFSEFRRAFHFYQGATGGTCVNFQTSVCYEDLVIDEPLNSPNAPGGNRIWRMKGVGCKSATPVQIKGNGQNVFIGYDGEESDGLGYDANNHPIPNTILVESDENQFINSAGAPQSIFLVTGDLNKFDKHRILHKMRVTGNQNTLLDPSVFGELIIENPTTIVDNPQLHGGTITGTYRQHAYKDELTSGGTVGPAGPAGPTGPTGPTGPQGPAGTGGGTSSSVIPSRSAGLVMGDPLTPVVAEGTGPGVGQAPMPKRYFVLTGNPRAGVENVLGSDRLSSYQPGPMIKASPAVWVPGRGTWTPANGTGDNDQIYGLPGVAVWSTRISIAGIFRRLTQRWYRVPGVPDVLYCELLFTLDPSSSDGAIFTPTAASDISPFLPRFDLMFESKSEAASGMSLGADSALNGLSFIGNPPNTSGVDPLWFFARCLTDTATGFYYEDAATPDANQNFGSGTLPGGSSYSTVQNRIYRAHVSVTPQQGTPLVYSSRFVVGNGHSLEAAKNAAKSAPNLGAEHTVRHFENRVGALPAPASLSASEARAWSYYMLTPIINERTERDWNPERAPYDGKHRRLTFAGIGRWNAVWQFDTGLGLSGHSQIDDKLVHDFLDYMLNNCMESNGHLRRDPSTSQTSMGVFFMARLARRYLAATGDTAFLSALYPKLKLLHTWWTSTAPAGYRHPNWPTVKLLTAPIPEESQEASPVTDAGTPAGDDWVTAAAYDFAVHMAYLASQVAPGDVAFWNGEAAAYKAAIRQYCWDAGQGWFQPVMKGGDNLGRFQTVRTYRAFWHLYAGIASPSQAATMKAQIMDPNIFLGNFGVRTVDKRWSGYDPNNWVRGGSRAYYDAAVSVGLRRYGFNAEADTVLQRAVDRQNAIGTTPETTNPDTGTGGFGRWLLAGVMIVEGLLAKRAPSMLGVDSGSSAIGLDTVTS